MNKEAIIIFVKNPTIGTAKTRIAAKVGDEQALAIYLELINITKNIVAQLQADVFVYYNKYIDASDSWSSNLKGKEIQEGQDLGAKMHHAQLSLQKKGYKKTILIGSDCPYIDKAIINKAFDQLEFNDFTLGPSKDGGYYLIGSKIIKEKVFENVEWSTNEVLHKTIKNIESIGGTVALLPVLSDIDFIEDWKAYKASLTIT